ncbi:NAD(P)-binding protein [Flexivirga sp. ID2601S]|uniref:NAD(P)-binding protein n=1 Tax=Flexivirga aerilata TaxID=1656889 RepID=A0A849AHT6_9MICO|nr:NAD(P)-binding protein [Flexivirga aerilata]
MPPHYAVIGSGVSGLVAAHVLCRTGRVTVFEADDRPGGHAHTHDVRLADGATVPVDSGFIVHNDRTYPTLQRLFGELSVETRPTDMSMSVFSERTGWQYAGGQGVRGILADPATVRRPAYLKMLWQVRRFHAAATDFLSEAAADDLTSIGDWLARLRFDEAFLEHFATPLVAAVWSCAPQDALSYPARSLLTFLQHHGMLTVTGSPTWRTVAGGSRTYVERVFSDARIDLELGTPVQAVAPRADSVTLQTDRAEHDFSAVVIATHPSAALAMLKSPSPEQAEVLGALRYSQNPALLHTDSSVLPPARAARASWNYRLLVEATDGVLVSYDLTRLMRLQSPEDQRVLVTLGGEGRVDPATVVARMQYEHPLYSREFVAAQARLPLLTEPRLAFAGAYHGWGFHEDGALSGLLAAEALGGRW